MSTLPSAMPRVAGYDMHATFMPASLTGGDTYDLALHGPGPADRAGRRRGARHRAGAVGDADARDAAHGVAHGRRSGNGVPPRQRPTGRDLAGLPLRDRVHRAARRAAASAALPQRRPGPDHPLRGGARARARRYKATSFPMGAMPLSTPASSGDAGLRAGRHAGAAVRRRLRVRAPRRTGVRRSSASNVRCSSASAAAAAEISAHLLDALHRFADGAPQEDDVTMVIVKRLRAATVP